MNRFPKSRRIVIANWKMYLESPKEAVKYAQNLRKNARNFNGVEAWIAAPFTLIPVVAQALKNSSIKIGAQTASPFNAAQSGVHTGEVSAAMLKNAGAGFVLVGHSERRAMGESEETVREQSVRALSAGLTAVLCVGEAERSAEGTHFGFIESQLRSACEGLQAYAGRAAVAYEPIWAIGKSAEDAMSPPEIQETAIFIKKVLSDALGRSAAAKIPILYGGSVDRANAKAIMEEGGVSGFLVGHASAKLDSFVEILKAVRPLRQAQGKQARGKHAGN